MAQAKQQQKPQEEQTDTSWMERDKKVWVELTTLTDQKADIFLQGVLLSFSVKEHLAQVQIPQTGKTQSVPLKQLYERAQDYQDMQSDGYDDMVNMEIINDAELLKNIDVRYRRNLIFTYVGPTLLVVNPFQAVPKIVNEDIKRQYIKDILFKQGSNYKDYPSHVYALSAEAFRCLFENKKNQSIVISGESGAGKTENAKLCMNLLTSIGQLMDSPNKAQQSGPGMEDRILSCNPILESFGNAKTVRNNNSSRFGKYVSMIVDSSSKKIKGAQIIKYLLEKSRLVQQGPKERNFHIFYFMIKGTTIEQLTNFGLAKDGKRIEYDNVRFLKSPDKAYQVDKIDDAASWQEIVDSFMTLKLKDYFDGVFRIVSAILLIGNLNVDKPPDNSNKCSLSPLETLETISNLLNIEKQQVEKCITQFQRVVGKEIMDSPMNQGECQQARDSFAKELYERLFTWLVYKLNETIAPEDKSGSSLCIGLLDIYGFEVFEKNSFEQLMINYTNEKLHQLYISYVFKEEKQVFLQQGLEQFCGQIKYSDNQLIMDLLDKNPTGIFDYLDEITTTKSQNAPDDMVFVNKIRKGHPSNPLLRHPKMPTNPTFIIVHTAKDVEYIATGFIEKNKDEVSALTLKVAATSKDPIVQELFAETGSKKDKTLSKKVRSEMNDLMRDLNACDVNFIRCIKPNDDKTPQTVWQDYTLKQIRYLGVLDSLKVRKINYPIRRLYETFYERYGDITNNPCFPILKAQNPNFKKLTEDLFKSFLPQMGQDLVLFGNTKIFLRIEAMQPLNDTYNGVMQKKIQVALKIRKAFYLKRLLRAVKQIHFRFARIKFKIKLFRRRIYQKKILRSTIVLQIFFKKFLTERKMKKYQGQMLQLQQYIHRSVEIQLQTKRQAQIIKIQKFIKNFLLRKKLRKFRTAMIIFNLAFNNAWGKIEEDNAIIIQKFWKGYLVRKQMKEEIKQIKEAGRQVKLQKVVVRIQAVSRGMIVRQRLKRLNQAAYYIQGYFRMKSLSAVFQRMRTNIVVIQRKVKEWLQQKRFLREQYSLYVKPLEDGYFQQRKLCIEQLFRGRNQTIQNVVYNISPFGMKAPPKIIELKRILIDEVLSVDIEQVNPRVNFFAYALDIEALADTSDIFKPCLSTQYRNLFEQLYPAGNPLQTFHVGGEHIIATGVQGKIYSWGSNDSFQCGHQLELIEEPILINHIDPLLRISQISLGENHSLLLTYEGEVYGFGCNQFGQLLGDKMQYQLKQIYFPSKVQQITTTLNTSFTVCENGSVYTWPIRDQNERYLNTPVQLAFPQGTSISQVAAGNQFAILMSSTGQLYSFGENEHGELGLGDINPRIKPTLIPIRVKFQQISCGFKHAAAKSTLEQAYVWGWGHNGQLGSGNFDDLLIPTEILRCQPLQVCAGRTSTILLQNTKTLLWCGTNSVIKRQNTFEKIKLETFTQTITEPHFSIIRVISTYSRTTSIIYLTIANHKYMFKNNPTLEKRIFEQLNEKWIHAGQTIDPPIIQTVSNHIAEKHIVKTKIKVAMKNPDMNQYKKSPQKIKPTEQSFSNSSMKNSKQNTIENQIPHFKIGSDDSYEQESVRVQSSYQSTQKTKNIESTIKPKQKRSITPKNQVDKLKVIKDRLNQLKQIPSRQWSKEDQEFLQQVQNGEYSSFY